MTRLTGISQKIISRLQGATNGISDVAERLSSGQRINRAVDDPAGISMLASLDVRSRLFTAGVRNVNDGISYLNIADSALGSLQDIVIRQTELAEQASNGSYTGVQRRALHDESQSLSAEYERLLSTTKFNGKSIFGVNQEPLTLHLGAESTDYLSLDIAQSLISQTTSTSAATYGLSSFSTVVNPNSVALADLNGDGDSDAIVVSSTADRVNILMGNGDGTFKARISYVGGTDPTAVIARDISGDGVNDLVWVNRNTWDVSFMLGNGDGTFKVRTTALAESSPYSVEVADFNGDGIADIVAGSDQTSTVQHTSRHGRGRLRSSRQLYFGACHRSRHKGL